MAVSATLKFETDFYLPSLLPFSQISSIVFLTFLLFFAPWIKSLERKSGSSIRCSVNSVKKKILLPNHTVCQALLFVSAHECEHEVVNRPLTPRMTSQAAHPDRCCYPTTNTHNDRRHSSRWQFVSICLTDCFSSSHCQPALASDVVGPLPKGEA